MEEQDIHSTQIILKELSDIKASLAVNTNETANIKSSIADIKSDMKEIKNDFVTRREYDEALKEIKNQISPLKKLIYGFIATILVAVVGSILKLIIK